MIAALPERLLRIVFILSNLSASAKRTLRKPGYNDLMNLSSEFPRGKSPLDTCACAQCRCTALRSLLEMLTNVIPNSSHEMIFPEDAIEIT
jgi:hypothetical protein